MTSIERYQLLLREFSASINGLKVALAEDIVHLNPTLQDLVKNGRIQKMEICTELAWKTAKFYLEKELGEVVASPKQVYRALLAGGVIDEKLLVGLLASIDDRNLLSHVYKEDYFEEIANKLDKHLRTFEMLYNLIK
jgi:nucleotidyltransferase substrate binding protein (TIGR01987 family)